jgi:uncharacterized protein YndB with AHSA1/START domain
MTHDGGLRLHMRRVFRAPRTAVFRSLTEPRELAKWWGPDGFAIPSVESDLRPGGAYRIAMRPPEGDQFYLVGEFLEVDPPQRLSYTFRWEDPDPEDRETVVTLWLRDIGGTSTELVLSQGDFATEPRHALHEEGWTQSFGKLDWLISSAALPDHHPERVVQNRLPRQLGGTDEAVVVQGAAEQRDAAAAAPQAAVGDDGAQAVGVGLQQVAVEAAEEDAVGVEDVDEAGQAEPQAVDEGAGGGAYGGVGVLLAE